MNEPLDRESLAVVEPHRLKRAETLAAIDSDHKEGLTSEEAARRRDLFGANEFVAARRPSRTGRFLNQFANPLIALLVVAAVVSYLASGELKTPLVVLTVVLLNAAIGFVQENRAERSLEALKKMLVTEANVRRASEMAMLPAAELVPGDIVVLQAGDRVPADGRLLIAQTLEFQESTLTGESHPVAKNTDVIDVESVGIGDRLNMAFMNTTISRGRGEMVVTATGMDTEVGQLADLLRSTSREKTPLQKQLDRLSRSLAMMAGGIVTAVFAIGIARGQPASDVLLTAVALAVAAIPEGLPAVTAVTLAIGVSRMAQQHAIVKRLAAVETLGCASVICSDKTGTLTLNQMTVVEIVAGLRTHRVAGLGYAPAGEIEGEISSTLVDALTAMALCNDATVAEADGNWTLVGDPTEGALVVLAAKGGVDAVAVRSASPRVAEVPFDSTLKFMVTAHRTTDAQGTRAVRLCVKGAPDVLLDRVSTVVDAAGAVAPSENQMKVITAHSTRLAGSGLRVLAIAHRVLTESEWVEVGGGSTRPLVDLVKDLTLLALVGIIDPIRPEVADAVTEAQNAGLNVKMITGDHPTTAMWIGTALGLAPKALTGAELDQLTDGQLDAVIKDIGVFARVAPAHKLRLVTALQRCNDVVAMTGDGVNDAPALKKADIGIAMGLSGTEVAKEAATVVLTDDNFATIIGAVRQGRTIYDNIVKFVRFQLSTTLGFSVLFLVSSILGIADGKPFTPIAILWVNMIMDGPPAMSLGVDSTSEDVMQRRPRPLSEPILTRARWLVIALSAVVMSSGTLAVLILAPGGAAVAGRPTVAATMAFNTFVLFQFFNLLNSRSDTVSVFTPATLRNVRLWLSVIVVLVLQVAITHTRLLERLFDTVSITPAQWLVCLVTASTVLWVEEARKFLIARRMFPS